MPDTQVYDLLGGNNAMRTAILEISRMTSQASENGVRSALSVIRGVADVEVSLESGQAIVLFDPHKAIPEQFRKAVWVMGCKVEQVTLEGAEPTEPC